MGSLGDEPRPPREGSDWAMTGSLYRSPRSKEQIPGLSAQRRAHRAQGTGSSGGVSLTLAQLQALAWTGQVLARWVLSPLQTGQHG